ncbi:MAG: hypothetical protein LBN95_09365 [Prevotellaceae bacterium]|jgi:hypothetical protein|nr:hypothetical protein [Prevotellaceae bacterium]
MKKYILLTGLIFVINSAFAQEETPEASFNVQSEQSSASLYTGTMGLNVPIYTISDPDFTLPISLSYTANGFMPEQLSGNFGINWNLSVGASLTRKIMMYSDEKGGRLAWLRDLTKCRINKDDLFDGSLSDISVLCNSNKVNFAGADIFYFNIFGNSGSFFIDYDGTIKVTSNSHINVDVSELQAGTDDNSLLKIKIIDNNGYTYVFGGKAHSISNLQRPNNDIYSGSTDEWHLTKIIAPNGRTLELNYFSDGWYERSNNGIEFKGYSLLNGDAFYCPSISAYDSDNKTAFGNKNQEIQEASGYQYHQGNPIFEATSTVDKRQKLVGVSIDDVDFNLSFNYSLNNSWDWGMKSILKSINLNIGSEEQKSMTFEYDSIQCSYHSYFYLKKIKTFMNGNYIFAYNNIPCLDISYTNSIGIGLSPQEVDTIQKYIDDYGYHKLNPFAGALTSVRNPMGGKMTFEYNRHSYSETKMFGYNAAGEMDILVENANRQDLYNNIRINKIKYFDESGALTETKTYSYNLHEITDVVQQNAPSNFPLTEDGQDVNTTAITLNNSSGMLNIDFSMKTADSKYYVFERGTFSEPYPVTYSKVTEKISYPTGKEYKTIYYFSDYNALPEQFTIRTNTDYLYEYKNLYFFTSQSARRGLLIKKQESENGIPIRQTEFQYQPLLSDYNVQNKNYLVTFYGAGGIGNIVKMYFGSSNPTSITTTDHINGADIITVTDFIYDTKNRLSEKKTDGIDGRKYFTKYRYADDILPLQLYGTDNNSSDGISAGNIYQNYSGFAGGFQQMQRQGWFGRPVEVVSGFYDENQTAHYTGGTISLFKRIYDNVIVSMRMLPTNPAAYLSQSSLFTPVHSGFAVLSQEWNLILENPISEAEYQNAKLKFNGGSIVFDDEKFEKAADYTYNNKLRLTQIAPANALPTSYVWDNKNLFPLSETTGRFTKTYEYKPFVGLISTTDARNIETRYFYDVNNRLWASCLYGGGLNIKIGNVYEYHLYH